MHFSFHTILWMLVLLATLLRLDLYQAVAVTYEYDAVGRLSQVTYNDGSRITYTYDDNSNLLAVEPSTVASLCPPDGDVNRDDGITPADARLVMREFLGVSGPVLLACERLRANVAAPRSPGITPADAVCILRRFLGATSCLD
jgi:YD repeat-containing protein